MKPQPTIEALLACATEAARAAGTHALENWDRRREVHELFRHDVKLQLDVESQAKAEAAIRKRFPGHAVLGEEDAAPAAAAHEAAGFLWVVDPIDGTVNFSHGYPLWCSSVAVRHRGESVAGAVFAPALGRLYQATADGPALCDGAPIHVSEVSSLAEAMVFTGMDKNLDPALPPFALFERIAENTQKARIAGSAALDLCQVAAGGGDGYFEVGIYLWDIAAGGLIVRRAGGRAEILGYQPRGRLRYLATNGHIHEDLKRLVNSDRKTEEV